jgi:Xaa-Pro aminopeptidase
MLINQDSSRPNMEQSGSSLRKGFLDKKMKLVAQTMEEHGIDMWIVFTREGNEDPLAEDLRFNDLTWRSAGIFGRDGSRVAIVGSLETELVKSRRFYDEVLGYGSEGVAEKLLRLVSDKKPKRIGVNRSYDLGAADGLSVGMDQYLRRALKEYANKLVSAEDLAITLRARLIPEEIDLVAASIRACEDIYDDLESFIRAGKTDEDVHKFARRLVEERSLGPAWGADHCPAVSVGNSPAGHLGYSGVKIKDGDFVKLDFGVSKDGYCSDIQHVYFVGKGVVPLAVKKMFQTALEANDAALSILKPGVPGYRVDGIARKLIVDRGYPDYPHALGHVLGRSTHEIGPLLGPRWPNRYGKQGDKEVQKDMVFTIEPSVQGKFGTCNLEQDVLVTKDGYKEMSKRQKDLIRVG